MRRAKLSLSLLISNKLSSPPLNYTTCLISIHQPHHLPPPISTLSSRRDPLAFQAALTFSSATNSPILGLQIHSQIIKLGFSSDIFSRNNLMLMYLKCEAFDHALKLFEEMPVRRNLVSWTSMISGSVWNDEYGTGLEFYVEMMRSGICPNEYTLASVLSACASIKAIKFGFLIHCVSLKIGMDENPFVGSSLLCMYSKCGKIESAEDVFEFVDHRDLACWNAMVEGYALNGYGYDATRVVSLMHWNGLIADEFTYISALKGCSITGKSNFGRQIHCLVIHNGFGSSTAVMNAVTDTYSRTGLNDYALKVFYRILKKDTVSWNTIITGFAQKKDAREVAVMFSKMLQEGLKPNHVSFSVLFRFCGASENLSLGLQLCCFTYHLGFFSNVLVANSLLNMFSKCGLVKSAYWLFTTISDRNVISWNEMIAGYNLNGYNIDALELFRTMAELGIKGDEFTYSTILGVCYYFQDQKMSEQIHAIIIKSCFDSCCFVCSSLINAYSKFGLIGSSFKVFQRIRVLDLASWGAMISSFSKEGLSYEAFSLLNSLRDAGEEPDEFIFGSILNSCANVTAYNQCKCIHVHVIKTGYEKHLYVTSAILDVYAKCGDISIAKQVFDYYSRYDDAILFNTMITAYAHHGLIKEAVELFERMKRANLYPSHATFVALMSAYSYQGLVEQGQCVFDSIRSTYGMHPSRDNYACLVDLLARNGLLKKAKDVIEGMPFEPWPAIWRSLLSGCRIYGNNIMGELAAERILQLMPNNDGAYMLLSNVYAENGRWEDAAKVRVGMEDKGVHKVPGYSMIET